MIRLLQILLLVALAWVVFRLVRNALARRGRGTESEPPRFAPTAQCARCGTFVPREQLDAAGVCSRCK